MLGDCCNGEQSHLVGFGRKWPTAVHHRGSSCKNSDPESCSCTGLPNAHTLWGALIGGPTRDDQISAEGALRFWLWWLRHAWMLCRLTDLTV